MYQDLEKTQASEPPMEEAQTPEAADTNRFQPRCRKHGYNACSSTS